MAPGGRAVLTKETWIKQPDIFVAHQETTREVFDFSAVDDTQDNLFLNTASKSRWLITTSVAGVAGALVIGAALVGTFGFGGIEGPAVAAQHSASIWQQASSRRKGDRAHGLSGIIGHSEVSEVIAERAYKKHSVKFNLAKSQRRIAAAAAPTDLVGSLAPDYPVRKTSATRSLAPVPGKPVVLNDQAIGIQLSSLAPAGHQNTTTVQKTANVSHTEQLDETIEVEQGDTLLQLLTERGTPKDKTQQIISAFKSVFSANKLKEGHKLHITYDNVTDKKGYETLRPIQIAIMLTPTNNVSVVLDSKGKYRPGNITTANIGTGRNSDRFRARARIRKSLYFAAKEQGIPERVIVEMMRVHAYDVDFQRQVRAGDSFEVFYDMPANGKFIRKRHGAVLYSALTLNDKTRGYYRFTTPDDGITDYYDAQGRSATKFLMRTPVNGGRITSSFGLRRHPILKTTKMHTGVDFAAPFGTPVKAAGHGIIEKVRYVGSYGKYVRIRHANGYKTAYAHLSRHAAGLKEGMKIQQDQVIGYVGSTGRSTGSHLHYEIIVNERHVNPMKLRMPTGRRLIASVRRAFMNEKKRIDQLMSAAPVSTQIASANK